ncbi:DUF397 domain-containing protein [Streptomyces griseocarneus]|uniref:DUF397 domain-containing protein n=1 Tax=Streptomyces griseocarneus TaxID=51201 RepID=UPI00167C9058|nr:DUF397 domain-containing protein [Streptomyces griseocarneus]MBZ6473446.1 DUF397 domain-containing protein [Streptomyces griseocarneus]
MRPPRADLSSVRWRKSSYSNSDGGDCVEVAEWRKSSYSNPDGGNCLEVADNIPTAVPVRDSKNPDGPALVFGAAAWAAFVSGLKGTTAQAHPIYGSKSQ